MIGIMGGTFNPIHYGHLLMCEHIREELNLEKIIFIPAQQPPHKSAKHITDAKKRFEMVQLAIHGNPFFEVSDIEMNRQGASYTVDTLKELKAAYGNKAELGLIIGADSLVQIGSWRSYQEIINLCTLIVAKRPDTLESALDLSIDKLRNENGASIIKSGTTAHDYSSTEIRQRIGKGLSIKYMVPSNVEAYILKNGLYG